MVIVLLKDLTHLHLLSPSLAFWVPGLIIVCCVLVELTIPHVNTLPDRADANDSMKVYKDPWVMLAAWHCAACQVGSEQIFFIKKGNRTKNA